MRFLAEGGTIIVDETLLSKIAFIKEGEFVETNGKPTLRLIGDVETINSGKIIVRESTKSVVRAIEPDDIIRAFLQSNKVENPMEYLKALCSATSANYPFYYLLKQSASTVDDAIQIVTDTKSRGQTKQKLLERLNGRNVPQTIIKLISTEASIKKRSFRDAWIKEEIIVYENDLSYCLNALMSLDKKTVEKHQEYIKKELLELYDEFFETAKSSTATDLRKAICRIDELLFFDE